jgi:replication factor C subunit 1
MKRRSSWKHRPRPPLPERKLLLLYFLRHRLTQSLHRYNAQSHPLPFMKASSVVNPSKKIAKEKPDLEEAMDDSEDDAILKDAAEDDAEEEEEDMDISKDKYVAKPKKKKAPAKAAAKGKGKKKADSGDEDDEEEEKPKPAAKKKAPAKPRTKK